MDNVDTAGSVLSLAASVRGLRIHDASPTIGPDLAPFLSNPVPVAHPYSDHATQGVAANVWEIHEHSGAHVDAPYHFDPNGPTIDLLPVDVLFFRPFKKYDLSPFDLQPGEPGSLAQLQIAADRGGFALEEGDVAILDFGFDQYLPGGSSAREPGWWSNNQPGLAEDACEYLASQRVAAVGSDTSACDLAVREGEMSAGTGHGRHFLPNGILIIESLRGLANVPSTGVIVALPLKLEAGTASPLRVLLLSDQ